MIFSYMEFKKLTKHSNFNNYYPNNLFSCLNIGFIKFNISGYDNICYKSNSHLDCALNVIDTLIESGSNLQKQHKPHCCRHTPSTEIPNKDRTSCPERAQGSACSL